MLTKSDVEFRKGARNQAKTNKIQRSQGIFCSPNQMDRFKRETTISTGEESENMRVQMRRTNGEDERVSIQLRRSKFLENQMSKMHERGSGECFRVGVSE